ncbi:MAG: hypothetical protein KDK99_04640 [Verrucomicrobiales bacterium]|nr:hypothetical protein [Verrucomicrobiales bacterium]
MRFSFHPTTLLLALSGLFLASCASVKSNVTPGETVKNVRAIYVEHNPEEDQGIDAMIASELRSRGYRSTNGPASSRPSGMDAVLRYNDKWMWDITMYLLQLDMALYRTGSGKIVEASSYRPSLQRKQPRDMVKETLDALLAP